MPISKERGQGVRLSAVPIAGASERSFEVFFEDEHRDLFAALWLVTRNRHEAEEIMQDAFLKLWERWSRVAELEDPTGYLYRTAMNGFRNRARRAGIALRKTVRLIPPDDGLERVEERESIVRALAPLTPRQRAAVVLTDVLGYSSEEAGDLLGVRASTVRVLAGRGRAQLREAIGEFHE
jgi:RNA polymerase sigma factor (sigma-70 family)